MFNFVTVRTPNTSGNKAVMSSGIFIGNSELKVLPREFLLSVIYQRRINWDHVMSIVEHFDINKVNMPKISLRDGKYYVIDGAHTLVAMAVIANDQPYDVACRVYHGLTFQQEAELFASQYDDTTKIPFKDELHAEFCAENPKYLAFKAITEKVGLTLNMNGRVGKFTIGALAKAWNIFNTNGPEFYEKMLRLILHTWHGEEWSLQASILGGVAAFMKRYPNFSEKRFIKYLSAVDSNMLMRKSVGIEKSRDIAYAVAIAKLYNTRGGKNAVNIDLLLI